MTFINTILKWLAKIPEFIADGFGKLFDFIELPLSYLFYFLEGIFYFITTLFNIVVKIIMIFVALFQFVMALIVGFLRTLQDLLTPSFNKAQIYMPSSSATGFQAVIEVVDPIGLLNIVPYIALALVWGGFIYKFLGLFGGNIAVKGGN